MVIKTLRWKVGAFGRLIDYVGRDLVAYVGRMGHEEMILHNLRPADDLDGIARQFAENDTYRRRRKNGVAMYHEVLSFHADDRAALTPEALEDLTREYLRLRAPRALAFACPHYDREHVHVHVAISGTEFRTSKTLRLSNRAFAHVRREIERYQHARYPKLAHSLVYLPERERSVDPKEVLQPSPPERCRDTATDLDGYLDCLSDASANEAFAGIRSSEGPDIDEELFRDFEMRVRELNALHKLQLVSEMLEMPREPAVDTLIEQYEDFLGLARDVEEVTERVRELQELEGEHPDRESGMEPDH